MKPKFDSDRSHKWDQHPAPHTTGASEEKSPIQVAVAGWDFGETSASVARNRNMACKTCDDLLAAYKRAVKVYTNAEPSFRGLIGDEFQLAFKELKRLGQACRDADEALMAHLRHDHSNRNEDSNSGASR